MEHLPIVIFEIVLCVFLAFAALAEILFRQIANKQKKIKELDTELDILMNKYEQLDRKYEVLEKFVHSNTEMVCCEVELEPVWYEKDPKYLDSLLEVIGNSLVRKMSEKFNEMMLERIKELITHKRYSEFLRTDINSLKPRFKIRVPIFRVDYEYIKLSDAEYIFR